MKRIAIGLLLAAVSTPAWADCASLPYTLTNGTVADASQVMADLNCLTLLGAGNFSSWIQAISPGAGTTGAMRARDATGNPDAAIVQFTNNAGTDQYGFMKFKKDHTGLYVSNGLYVAGSSGGLSAWTNLSDGRLKKNIQQITGGLNTVMQLRGVRYNWKQPAERPFGADLPLQVDEPQVGFIAQELGGVIPEAVSVPSAADQPYAVKPTEIVPFLVEAIKEQQAEIKALQDQVAALQAK